MWSASRRFRLVGRDHLCARAKSWGVSGRSVVGSGKCLLSWFPDFKVCPESKRRFRRPYGTFLRLGAKLPSVGCSSAGPGLSRKAQNGCVDVKCLGIARRTWVQIRGRRPCVILPLAHSSNTFEPALAAESTTPTNRKSQAPRSDCRTNSYQVIRVSERFRLTFRASRGSLSRAWHRTRGIFTPPAEFLCACGCPLSDGAEHGKPRHGGWLARLGSSASR